MPKGFKCLFALEGAWTQAMRKDWAPGLGSFRVLANFFSIGPDKGSLLVWAFLHPNKNVLGSCIDSVTSGKPTKGCCKLLDDKSWLV